MMCLLIWNRYQNQKMLRVLGESVSTIAEPTLVHNVRMWQNIAQEVRSKVFEGTYSGCCDVFYGQTDDEVWKQPLPSSIEEDKQLSTLVLLNKSDEVCFKIEN